jgi:hypothetical protein
MNQPNPRVKARQLLVQLAGLESQELGQPVSPFDFYPVKVEKLIREVLNWELEQVQGLKASPYGDETVGMCDFPNRRILINVMAAEKERRFTIAHEIGHAVLHRESCQSGAMLRQRSLRKRNEQARGTPTERLELAANVFASELVMPERAVQAHFARVWNVDSLSFASSRVQEIADLLGARGRVFPFFGQCDRLYLSVLLSERSVSEVPSLSDFFGVSPTAMSRRIRELGLLHA